MQKETNTRKAISAFLAALIYAALASSPLTAAEEPVSPLKIEMPAIESVSLELSVPVKIEVISEIVPGKVGMKPQHWGEKQSLYYGGLEWRQEEGGFIYVDPLEKDVTDGREHYELVYYGDVLAEILYRNAKGNLEVDENYEAAIVRNRYDKDGNLIEESSYNPDKTLKNDWYGFAIYRWEYGENHRKVSGAFYDADGKLTHKKFSKVAVNRWAFDNKGNRVLLLNYDVNGNLIKDILGAAARSYQNNEKGQKTLEMIYGPDLKPANGKYGYAAVLRKYDEKGNITEISYYGPDLEPVEFRGTAVLRFRYNPDNKPIESAFYDARGNLSMNYEEAAIILDFYDEKRKKVRQKIYDEKKLLIEELVLDPDTEKWQQKPHRNTVENKEE